MRGQVQTGVLLFILFTLQFVAMATRYQILNFGDTGKLDDTNYLLWKMKVKSHLVLRESWEIATGVEMGASSSDYSGYDDYSSGDNTSRCGVSEIMAYF